MGKKAVCCCCCCAQGEGAGRAALSSLNIYGLNLSHRLPLCSCSLLVVDSARLLLCGFGICNSIKRTLRLLIFSALAPAVTHLTQFSKMFLFALSLVGFHWITAAAEELMVVTALQNGSISLNCTAQRKHGVDYRAVRWYKESVDPRLTGLVSRTPPSGNLKWYVGADMRISLEYPSLNLLLPPVSCSDSGVYQCHMAAPVGEQNREGRIRLNIIGCPTDAPTDPPMTRKEDVEVIKCNFYTRSDGYVLICGAVAVLFLSLAIFLMSYRWLKNAFWHNTKTPGKEPYPDPNSLPEKQDLLWITTLGPPPKKSDITAA